MVESSGAPDDQTTIWQRPARPPELNIPGYQVLQKLGEGGMGEVYEAEQIAPMRRRVAIKVIKSGIDTEQVIARFETERQALAS